MLTIQDIQLPLAGWSEIEPSGDTRRWRNSAGDRLTLDFFGLAPDLPQGPETIRALGELYRDALGDGGGIVEVEPTVVASVRSVQAIFKVPQDPSGMTYLGSLRSRFETAASSSSGSAPSTGRPACATPLSSRWLRRRWTRQVSHTDGPRIPTSRTTGPRCFEIAPTTLPGTQGFQPTLCHDCAATSARSAMSACQHAPGRSRGSRLCSQHRAVQRNSVSRRRACGGATVVKTLVERARS